MSDITQAIELAKQGGRLSNDNQWILADALKDLEPSEITQVAVESGRNEDTLLQYARAAERWFPSARVEGVSFSAHRVALSWHDPTGLLKDLKARFGSPTVRQVRVAMGLEGHEAIETLEKGIKKLDEKVSSAAIDTIIGKLDQAKIAALGRERIAKLAEPEFIDITDEIADAMDTLTEPDEDRDEYGPIVKPRNVEKEEVPSTGTWKSPISTADLIGM